MSNMTRRESGIELFRFLWLQSGGGATSSLIIHLETKNHPHHQPTRGWQHWLQNGLVLNTAQTLTSSNSWEFCHGSWRETQPSSLSKHIWQRDVWWNLGFLLSGEPDLHFIHTWWKTENNRCTSWRVDSTFECTLFWKVNIQEVWSASSLLNKKHLLITKIKKVSHFTQSIKNMTRVSKRGRGWVCWGRGFMLAEAGLDLSNDTISTDAMLKHFRLNRLVESLWCHSVPTPTHGLRHGSETRWATPTGSTALSSCHILLLRLIAVQFSPQTDF